MEKQAPRRLYYPQLDVLRFLAFLLVFINHTPFIAASAAARKLHEYGWLGVDLFLCLSGFLITKLLVTERQRMGQVNIRFFYLRRILRIWPLYFFAILLSTWLTLQRTDWNTEIQQRVFGMVFFSDNLLSAFMGYNFLAFTVHLWTISYEEQFYAFIPWVIRWTHTFTRRKWLILFGCIFLAGNFLRALLILIQAPHPVIYVLPFTHFESILGGIVIGLGLFENASKKINRWAMLTGGVVVLFLVSELPNTEVTGWNLMLTYPLAGLGMTLILQAVLRDEQPHTGKPRIFRIFVPLGKISYGLYIYHLACLALANAICLELGIQPQTMVAYPLAMFVTGLSLTILAAALSYLFLEKPFLRVKERYAIILSRPP